MTVVQFDGVMVPLENLTDDELRDLVKRLETIETWLERKDQRNQIDAFERSRLRKVRAARTIVLDYVNQL